VVDAVGPPLVVMAPLVSSLHHLLTPFGPLTTKSSQKVEEQEPESK
jgi:hypothetical protein